MDIEANRYRPRNPFHPGIRAAYTTGRLLYKAFQGVSGNPLVKKATKYFADKQASAAFYKNRKMPPPKRKLSYAQVARKKPRTTINRPGGARVLRINQRPAVFQNSKVAVARATRKQKWSGGVGGTGFVGKFKRPTRRGANVDAKYVRTGASLQYENSGTVTDANCVYVGHSVIPVSKAVLVTCMAVLRPMFEKEGQQISSPEVAIGDSGLYVIDYFRRSAATGIGGLPYHTYVNAVGFNLQECAQDMATNVILPLYTHDINEDWFLSEIRLRRTNSTPVFPIFQRVDVQMLTLHIKGTSAMKVQNRTATTAGAEADDVDNQPLKGKIYEMKGLQPVYTGEGAVAFPVGKSTGVNLTVAGTSNILKDPPHPKLFGAKKAANIMINPGQIKYSTLKYERTCDLDWFFKQAQLPSAASSTVLRSTLGTNKLYAFEKMINVGTNEILIAFEAEFDCKAYVTNKPKKCIAALNLFDRP